MCTAIGARRRGNLLPEVVAHPGFENDDVICCIRAKYPKFFPRAFGARIVVVVVDSDITVNSSSPYTCHDIAACP